MSVKKYLKSSLLNNVFYLFLLQGFGYIFPILLIPFLISTIGVEKYGLVYFAIAFAWYFQIVSELGFDLSNVKHIVGNKNNQVKINEVFSVIITIRLILSFILFGLYVCIILYNDKFREYIWLYLIAYIRVFAAALTPYWFFRSVEKVKEITKISLLARTVSILPIFFIVKEESDYLWVMFFMTLNEIIAAILAMHKIFKVYHLKLDIYTINQYLYYLKDTIPFFTSNILIRLYKNSNIVVLGFFTSSYWTGIYSVSEKIYAAYNSVIIPLIQHVFYPYFMRIKDIVKINKMILFSSVGNIVLAILLYLIVPYVLPLFIMADHNIILSCFNLFLLLICIDVPNNFLGYPYCGITNNISKLTKSTFAAVVFHFCGLILLNIFNLLSVYNIIILLIATQALNVITRVIILREFLFRIQLWYK